MVKLCMKCGSDTHTNRSCKGPVTSFGLIVYTNAKPGFEKGRLYPFQQVPCAVHDGMDGYDMKTGSIEGETLVLLVERKDTVGFLSLVQGSYPDLEPYRSRKIAKYVHELTCEERQKLLSCSFSELWKIAGSEKKDSAKAQRRFEALHIAEILKAIPCCYREADYIMPKGRLKYGETVKQCAVREFAEETGYSKYHVDVLDIPPFEENFIGTDGKTYRNVFFVARLRTEASILVKLGDDPMQTKEVRNLGWFDVAQCMELMRPYHIEKKKILLGCLDRLAAARSVDTRFEGRLVETSRSNLQSCF